MEFLLILGVPPGGGRWVDWGGSGYGCVGVSHACMHPPACACMHAHMHMHVVNMINMDASMGVAICNFYTCIHVCACMCIHACMCAHVWGHPHAHAPRHPHPPAPSPRATGTPKHQNSISLKLIKIF